MKKSAIFSAIALCSAFSFTGCESQTNNTKADKEIPAVPQFSPKNGLLLPEQTRQSLGLKLVDVKEQKLSSSLKIGLRIYRKSEVLAFASGSVTPEEASLLSLNQSVEILLPDGEKQSGTVTEIHDGLKKSIGSSEILVEIPAPASSLAVGTFIHATSTVESKAEVVTIPSAAVLGCSEGQFVYAVSGEHLVRTAVKVGASNSDLIEITEGLYAGDQVVLEPVLSLWMTELAAVKGGQACCIEPPKGK